MVQRFHDVMANLRLYSIIMCCVGLEHDKDKEQQADAGLEQGVEGEGDVDYTEHPRDDGKDVPVTLMVALSDSDAVELIAWCGTDEKEK